MASAEAQLQASVSLHNWDRNHQWQAMPDLHVLESSRMPVAGIWISATYEKNKFKDSNTLLKSTYSNILYQERSILVSLPKYLTATVMHPFYITITTKYSHIYIELHSVCPLVGIGTPPTPLPKASVPLPLQRVGGGHIRLRLCGWGSPNSDEWRISLALCLLCVHHRQSCGVLSSWEGRATPPLLPISLSVSLTIPFIIPIFAHQRVSYSPAFLQGDILTGFVRSMHGNTSTHFHLHRRCSYIMKAVLLPKKVLLPVNIHTYFCI